jgi:preprotein translocase subunit SecD
VNLGKTVRTAVRKAFDSAFRTNLAGNTVTLAAAVILYFLAVGPVRGFALMLGLATVLDIVILYFFTRPVVYLMSNTKLLSRKNLRAVEKAATPAAATAGGRR